MVPKPLKSGTFCLIILQPGYLSEICMTPFDQVARGAKNVSGLFHSAPPPIMISNGIALKKNVSGGLIFSGLSNMYRRHP